MGDVNLEIKLGNLDERVIKIEESGGGSGGDGYITSVSNDFNVVNKKLSLSNDITTKLSKVDTQDNLSVELAKKIDKPASATNGQVLTYNGTSNEWEAQDSKGGSITEPTDLEKGIIGGDEWVSGGNYTIGESVVIDENKLYLLVGDGGSITKPSTDTTHSIWEETSISALNSKVNSSLVGNVTLKDVITKTLNYNLISGGAAGINCGVQHEENDDCFCQVLSNTAVIVTPYLNENNIWCAVIYNCQKETIPKDTLQVKFTIIKH